MFCERMRWWPMRVAFEQLQPQMSFAAPPELQPLIMIGLNAPRARSLADQGYTVEKIARCRLEKLMRGFEYDSKYEPGLVAGDAKWRREQLRKQCEEIQRNAQNRLNEIKQEVCDEQGSVATDLDETQE